MKPLHSRILVLCLVLIGVSFGFENVRADENTSDRWEKSIVEIEKKVTDGQSPKGGILFVGSSSIRLWELEKFFPEIKAANHGFGGSFLADSVFFFDRIVVPVQPSVIVVYAGDNDIASGKSPEEVHRDFERFVSAVRERLPECRRVVYIAIKPSVRRWAMAGKIRKANALIQSTCADDPLLRFADVWGPMLTDEGQPNAELLVEDGLHMNEKGYKVWAAIVRPLLDIP